MSQDKKNAVARHEIFCTLEDVIVASNILLKDRGKLYMVHRANRIADVFCTMRKHKIEPKLIKMVQPNEKKAPNLILIEGQKNGGVFLNWENTLYIYNDKGEYTKEIKEIYGLI
ncbi:tRNA1(Val) (adenine(37)-N6)-methyltransferase [Clostridium acetireducens DSM 10703]|uniref:tRNA1(Val) (Adenine(37)-N6)-methyltransferase n=1 Tax=Clostridium acetireducens DSM 10703 TaxID=1121290 RepID=A0A1E8EWD3_9CLOT|nr:tRNA1(Val) (adenine(37)-N6)-methyltransferase [Clostridium acetireducens DSM 10703]